MTKYVALLRGINVGGNNKVEMPKLKTTFESLSFTNVKTYINTGNVLFDTNQNDIKTLTKTIEETLTTTFGFSLRIVLRDKNNIEMLCNKIPADWENNDEQRTNVLFLWEEVNSPESINLIKTNPEVDTLICFDGAIVWNINKINYNKSGLHKFIGTKIYKNMTARNINTVRKIGELMK